MENLTEQLRNVLGCGVGRPGGRIGVWAQKKGEYLRGTSQVSMS